MPTKKEDWSAQRAALLNDDKNVTGPSLPTNPKFIKVLLKPGTRRSVGNDVVTYNETADIMNLLRDIQVNLDYRTKTARGDDSVPGATHRQRLKGLFGGGE